MSEKSWRAIIANKIEEETAEVILVIGSLDFFNDKDLVNQLEKTFILKKCKDDVDLFMTVQNAIVEKKRYIVTKRNGGVLPYSLEKKIDVLELSPSLIFPLLDLDVLIECNSQVYNQLYSAYEEIANLNRKLNKADTIDIILQALFKTKRNITNIETLIYIIATTYVEQYTLPNEIFKLIREASDKLGLSWAIMPSSKDSEIRFWVWLSKMWNLFIQNHSNEINFYKEPLIGILPRLFNQGLIKRVQFHNINSLGKLEHQDPVSLLGIDMKWRIEDNLAEPISLKIKTVKELFKSGSNTPEVWLGIARNWAELRYFQFLSGNIEQHLSDEIESLGHDLDREFNSFMTDNYDRLISGSTFKSPLTVDKILGHLSVNRSDVEKIALIVFDGMGLSEWEIVKNYLLTYHIQVKEEKELYTILPSLTNYSRQSIFSGMLPSEFSDSLNSPKEEYLFTKFWQSVELPKSISVFYSSFMPLNKYTDFESGPVVESIDEGVSIIGLVTTFIDSLMHSNANLGLGKRLYHKEIRTILRESKLEELFIKLLSNNYRVFITSDHGSVFGEGNGYRPTKTFLDRMGKRCLVYDRKTLAEEARGHTNSNLFTSRFLPDRNYVLFPNGQYFFGNIGTYEITHGGVSLEESVVTLSEVEYDRVR